MMTEQEFKDGVERLSAENREKLLAYAESLLKAQNEAQNEG